MLSCKKCRPAALPVLMMLLSPAASIAASDWVERSNGYATLVLEQMAAFNPESAGGFGVAGVDENVVDLGPQLYERNLAASGKLLARLESALGEVQDRRVRQDLGILIKSVRRQHRDREARARAHVAVPESEPDRVRRSAGANRPADRAGTVSRGDRTMRKYAGLATGTVQVAELARDRSAERFSVDGLVGPYRGQVEQDLARSETLIEGIGELLEGTDLEGWRDSYKTLADSCATTTTGCAPRLLPRAREDFRLPPVMYANALKNWGVEDDSPEALIETATKGYMDIRNEYGGAGAAGRPREGLQDPRLS